MCRKKGAIARPVGFAAVFGAVACCSRAIQFGRYALCAVNVNHLSGVFKREDDTTFMKVFANKFRDAVPPPMADMRESEAHRPSKPNALSRIGRRKSSRFCSPAPEPAFFKLLVGPNPAVRRDLTNDRGRGSLSHQRRRV